MKSIELKEYTLEKISILREVGFYQEFVGQEKRKIYNELNPRFKMDDLKLKEYFSNNDLGEEYLKMRLYQELFLIDKSKCLPNEDGEWVYQEGDYLPLIKGLSRISNGCFNPIEIEEKWKDGPSINIKITTSTDEFLITPEYRGDWADTKTVLKTLNKLFDKHSYCYVFDEGVITFLNLNEKKELKEFGIRLIEPEMN